MLKIVSTLSDLARGARCAALAADFQDLKESPAGLWMNGGAPSAGLTELINKKPRERVQTSGA